MLLLILILVGVLSAIALLIILGISSSMEVQRYGTQNIQVESLPRR